MPLDITRRRFCGGSLAAAGMPALAEADAPAAAARAPAALRPAQWLDLALEVNGQRRRLRVEPATTLAEALRGPLGLTGTKIACNRGACSACTVLLDGAVVPSCMVLAADAADRRVTTVEGLAHGEQLHPVQEAFIAHDAVQCGFCTPGMVMACAGLLEQRPHAGEAEIREAIGGHLCRCGTHPHVVEAMLSLTQGKRAG